MFYQIIFVICYSTSVFANFYEILGVSRSATDFDIKTSYKKLARKWHPDKNKNPEANDHFTKINEAYEALSNPEKRREYDAFGSISNEPRNNQQHQWSGGGFNNAYFDFGENEQAQSNYQSTNYRHYKINILPNSYKQPTLILLVSHFCFSCHHAMRLWASIATQITESGINIALADVMADGQLREELQIQHVPTVVMIIGGQIRYMQSEINKETVIDFIRYSFPSYLVQSIQSEDALNSFHDSWITDSRAKMIMTKPLDRPSFRFLSIAFKYRDKISAGFIHLEDDDDQTQSIINTYGLRKNEETILIFHDQKLELKEDRHMPRYVAKKSQVRLTLADIEYFAESNYLLPLPRLLSQSVFDQACPPPSQRQRSPGFCIITVVDSSHSYNLSTSDTWHRVRSLVDDHHRGKVLYLFGDVQAAFIESLKLLNADQSPVTSAMNQVILLWRHSYSSASSLLLSDSKQYTYLEILDTNWEQLSDYDNALTMVKPKATGNSDKLSELVNELADPWWVKIGLTMIVYAGQTFTYVYDLATEPFNLIMSVVAVVLISYVFSTLKTASTNLSKDSANKPHQNSHHQESTNYSSSIAGVPELTEESYLWLRENVQPGLLIFVVLTTDMTPKHVLASVHASLAKLNDPRLQAFSLACDTFPRWLHSLLDAMDNAEDRSSAVSSVQALSGVHAAQREEGIVLALNIGRHYLSVCPVNLVAPEAARHTEDKWRYSGHISSDGEDVCDSGRGGSPVHRPFFEWLCQLTEGTCRRYYVGGWPASLA